jgi:nitrogen regulatory protein P-II 1
MKKIEALIKEEHLIAVKTALEDAGHVGMTVYKVKGRGSSGGITLEWRAGSYKVDFLSQVMLMLVVADEHCQAVVDIIVAQCQQTGSDAGGKIFITPVESVIRIRTGERDLNAL